VALLAGWERERRKYLTIDDLRAAVGRDAARYVASKLAQKGALERLQRGLYLVRPFRSFTRPTASSAPAALGALLHAEPYYLGGLWAFSQCGLSGQQHVSVLDAFVTRARPRRTLAGARVVFHVLPTEAMDHGISGTDIEGVLVRVSDPERTLLDALDHPRIVGGLRRAVELFKGSLLRVDTRRLAEFAARSSRTSTCQRVGALLERAGASRSALRALEKRTRGTRSLIAMQPGRRTGGVNPRWNVVENDRAVDVVSSS
jgi:predicted transcriptional regulator of viral defense system